MILLQSSWGHPHGAMVMACSRGQDGMLGVQRTFSPWGALNSLSFSWIGPDCHMWIQYLGLPNAHLPGPTTNVSQRLAVGRVGIESRERSVLTRVPGRKRGTVPLLQSLPIPVLSNNITIQSRESLCLLSLSELGVGFEKKTEESERWVILVVRNQGIGTQRDRGEDFSLSEVEAFGCQRKFKVRSCSCAETETWCTVQTWTDHASDDRVFGQNCSTREVYDEGAKEVALSVVNGINSSIFAYGQTSSGKTYTMTGITEYAVSDIYDYVERHRDREFKLKFSAMEIYNEALRDLLSSDSAPLRLLDDPERGTVVDKLTEETLRDRNHLQELLSICEAQRQIGETALNETSSRSHQILRLTIESSAHKFVGAENSSSLAATVSFVDLAGSERASQTLSEGTRLKEGCHINRSLLTLGTVIRKLSKGRNVHIPYRDSKLTRILQNSLGGNARTAIICTMSPARSHIEQSRNTLLFASCAKEVSTNAHVNVVMSDKILVKHLQREMARLESELRSLELNHAANDSTALLKEKELLIEKMDKEIKDLTQQRDLAHSQIEDLLKSIGEDQSKQSMESDQISEHQVQNTWSDEPSASESSDMPNSHCLDLDLTTCSSSQYSDHDNGLNSRGDSLQLPENSENHFPSDDASSILSTNTPIFVGPNPCQGWEKTIQGLDRNTEDDTSLPCPEEKDGKLALTVAGDKDAISSHDKSSSRSLRLNRSRSCRSVIMTIQSPLFDEAEQGESILPNGLDEDFPGRPEGFLPKLAEMEFGDGMKKFSRQDSRTSVRSVSMDEKAQNVKTSGEWDTNSAHNFVAKLYEMAEVQSAMELGDDTVMETTPDADDTAGKIKTYFFLLFKGNKLDSVYMEVELRRLYFLKESFSHGSGAVKDDQPLTLASSKRALNREREMLIKQVQKRFSRKEMETIYQKWGIDLDSKQRKLQLARRIWSDIRDMNHIRESAALVAKEDRGREKKTQTTVGAKHMATLLSTPLSRPTLLPPYAPQRSADALSEIKALTAFKLNLHDPLGALDGWNSSTPSAPCDWRAFSVTMAEFGNFAYLVSNSCSLLRAVYLHYNSFSGGLPPALTNLTNLQVLNVAHNFLSGGIPGNLPRNLRYLDLSSNAFSGNIPANFSVASSLQLINLSFNQFSGGVPASIGELQQLQYLWLDSNQLYGTIPSAISNCSSLLHLSAEDNALKGLIPATLGAIPKLRVLSLSRNELSGSVPASMFCNVSANPPTLVIVQLGFNAFTGIFKPQNATFFSVLEVLDLQENHIHGVFPSWLTEVSTLRILDLSGNFFSGILPIEIGNLLRLEELRVANNSLQGGVPREIQKCSLLQVLDLEGNRFQLEVLNLSENNLIGDVLEELLLLSNLSILNLSFNKFYGEVWSNIGDLSSLQELNMSGCGFSGRLPKSIGSLMKLATLDLSKQNMSGELPLEIFGLPNLQVVALQENLFSGDVPEGFSSLLSMRYLNLSSNAFSGELGNCSDLEALELRSNRLSGEIPGELSRLSHLKELDLGQNNLTGEIPEDISKCSSMTSLLLDANHLSGPIPDSLSKLSNLTMLNLSSNRFSGVIPVNFSGISTLKYLNLSQNNLEGEIPKMLGSQFTDPSVFAMNPKLCGKPLKEECEGVTKRKRRKLILLVCVAVGGATLLALCCCGYIFSLLRWRKTLREGAAGEKKRSPAPSSGGERGRGSGENGGPKLVMFNNKITYAETLEATRQFDEENVLSRGRYGLVFKASFQDGMVLSIRRLPDGSIEENTFRKEAESLGKVKHRNLTVLRGYYAGPPDVRLLVYDYMPNGNLATLLQEASHQDGHVLNWPMRHLIALGIARGLSFLHSVSMVHGDVKPQNVLFDADFEAHLSDFGLDRLTIPTPAEPSSSTTPIGSLGYVSPEAALTGEATKEADVYSFGIVLLEILTELLEPGLLEIDPESSEWEEFLLGVKVGLLCTAPDPLDRPSMSDIVFMLEGCRVGPDIPSSADPTSLPSPV
ncbi:putative LRR receptor-like serine/threonine-protein kinase [Vitis vinifera]|uniref:non-specific serine/threonine protein kinase n=2 Tax=Magnoliopsida TaxID=3398 RepID=A0A438ERK8_VITVI|nr:putative LRR receptor-like serine/threonine-protein kinase [Vitis vinifera]